MGVWVRGTGDYAAAKFNEWVKLANGDSLLVYEALTSKENPTEGYIKEYIEERTK